MDQGFIRLLVFACVLLLMASAEALWPRKERALGRSKRWLSNLTLSVLNTVILKLLGPITAIAVAEYALANNYGFSHKIPLLWRFHKVHHADRDIDVTTGIRFHPIEALFSMVYKCIFILILGPIPFAVFLFEVVLNGSGYLNG